MSRSLVVISAGLSQPSSTRLLADRLVDAVTAKVGARGEAVDVHLVELRELAIPLAQAMATGGLPTPELDEVKQRVSAADAVIAVTPVFSASYSGLFKMFFDVLGTDALNGMPVIVAATAGTARHSLVLDYAMRPLFTYLRAVVVPTGVFAATEDFGGDAGSELTRRVQRAADELAALMVAAPAVEGFVPSESARTRTAGVGVDQKVTPFEALLRGHEG